MSFPLPFVPKHTYHTGGCRFGADRPNGRKHAACDLLAPLDTPVLAVARGLILRGPYKFYKAKSGVWPMRSKSSTLKATSSATLRLASCPKESRQVCQ